MELAARIAHHHQVAHRSASLGQQRQRFGLGIERIEFRRLAVRPAARGFLARQHHRERCPLVARTIGSAQVAAADFEQPQSVRTAIHIALGRAQQAGDQRGAHRLHVFANRVVQHPQLAIGRAVREMFRIGHRQERPRHRLVQPPARRSTPQPAFQRLRGGGGRTRNAFRARQGHAGDLIQPGYADNFLDQIGGAFDIVAAEGDGYLPISGNGEIERGQDAPLFGLVHRHPAQAGSQRRIKRNHLGRVRRSARAHNFARLTAAQALHQRGQAVQPAVEPCRVYPAFKPCARIAGKP